MQIHTLQTIKKSIINNYKKTKLDAHTRIIRTKELWVIGTIHGLHEERGQGIHLSFFPHFVRIQERLVGGCWGQPSSLRGGVWPIEAVA